MAVPEETGEAATFGFVAVDREGVVAAASGMRHVVSAAAKRSFVPGIHDVEHQRCVKADGWMKAVRRLPGAVTHSGNILAICACGMKGNS